MSKLKFPFVSPVLSEPSAKHHKIVDGLVTLVSVEGVNPELNFHDFSVESLVETGSLDLLKNQVTVNTSRIDVADSVAFINDNLGDHDINSLNDIVNSDNNE